MSQEQDPARRERELVLSEYGTWRLTAEEDAPVADEIRTLETLLRLKAEHLGTPAPGQWDEELVTDLLTEVMPRTVVQPREQVMDVVPTLARFVAYLRETGRWHALSQDAAEFAGVLGGLEFAALEAADDPTRRSFSTNVLGYGMSLGVDLEDEDELAAFMHWYNALPDQERLSLSETGRLSAPSRPYETVEALRAVGEAERTAWPWFLPEPARSVRAFEGFEPEPGVQVYRDNDFVARALALLDAVGQGRAVTATGALGRAETAQLLAELGIGRGVRSMWDHPEIAGPWTALRDGGWLEVEQGRVRRAAGPVPVATPNGDPEAFVEFAHAVLTAMLLGREARAVADGGFRGMPDTAAALLVCCREEGLPVPGPKASRSVLEQDPEQLSRWFRVRDDLEQLVGAGALEWSDGRFHGSAALLMAVAALLHEGG